MMSDERRAWLAQLKVGDEVGITGYSYHYGDQIDVVERLTPSQFVLSGTNRRFRRSDGRLIGQTSPYSFPKIVPINDGIRETVDRRKFEATIRKTLPIATVRKLLAVLAEAEQDGKGEG